MWQTVGLYQAEGYSIPQFHGKVWFYAFYGQPYREILSAELSSVNKWLSDNNLFLHLRKTESLGFSVKVGTKSEVSYHECELNRYLNGETGPEGFNNVKPKNVNS